MLCSGVGVWCCGHTHSTNTTHKHNIHIYIAQYYIHTIQNIYSQHSIHSQHKTLLYTLWNTDKYRLFTLKILPISIAKIDFRLYLNISPYVLIISQSTPAHRCWFAIESHYIYLTPTNFWLKTQKKNTPFLVCSLCVLVVTLLYMSPIRFLT